MANSRFEYVKQFERENFLLPETHIVIRVDGKGFHKFSAHYGFDKPNDIRALNVMNRAAQAIVAQFPDIQMAYGDSDEYSFLLRRTCELFERREMKLVSTFASFMSVYYVMEWNREFPEKPLVIERLPTFDARAVVYPNVQTVRDYFSWRQVDCHINNLYNTTFWKLIEKCGMTGQEAENYLSGTVSSDKNEILFSKCGINYNNEPEIFKKGTVIVREYKEENHVESPSERQKQRIAKARKKAQISVLHVDIIKGDFWSQRPWLLE
ncbi:tRNA(His) guanylyltransferase [Candidozyma auris]|nr:tRNA(His) guanylyltransferase [[Candida] auris]QEL60049.1 tRNA(His) guanylyltransferase [[Candida] auris]